MTMTIAAMRQPLNIEEEKKTFAKPQVWTALHQLLQRETAAILQPPHVSKNGPCDHKHEAILIYQHEIDILQFVTVNENVNYKSIWAFKTFGSIVIFLMPTQVRAGAGGVREGGDRLGDGWLRDGPPVLHHHVREASRHPRHPRGGVPLPQGPHPLSLSWAIWDSLASQATDKTFEEKLKANLGKCSTFSKPITKTDKVCYSWLLGDF